MIKKVSAGREGVVNSSPGISLRLSQVSLSGLYYINFCEICVIQTKLVKNKY